MAGLLRKLGAHLNFSAVQSLAIKVEWKRCVGMGRDVVTRLNCVAVNFHAISVYCTWIFIVF